MEILLREKDVQVNQLFNGYTPLAEASFRGHDKIVEQLLQHKDIDVNAANEDGYTPLLFAVQEGHGKIVKQLLSQAGVQVNLSNKHGTTPLIKAA